MRTGKDLILATKAFTSENTLISWWAVISTGSLLAGSIVCSLLCEAWQGKLVCSILSALLFVRFFVIYHDHQHHTILPHSRLAKWIMRIWGILALTPNSIWKHSHNYHHNNNSRLRSTHIGSFAVMTTKRYAKASRIERIKYLTERHCMTILMGYFTAFMYGMCILPVFEDSKEHRDSLFALAIHVLAYSLIIVFFGWASAFFALFLTFFLASGLGAYLFYAQHNFPEVSYFDKDGWTYEAAALESSSHCKMGPLMNYFTANIGYHHIHHLNAKIPFYRLPEVYRSIPELKGAKTTSLHPLEVYRCLRLKLWDADAQKMVSLREAIG